MNPSARAAPRTKVVLPAPSSPETATTSPGASARPTRPRAPPSPPAKPSPGPPRDLRGRSRAPDDLGLTTRRASGGPGRSITEPRDHAGRCFLWNVSCTSVTLGLTTRRAGRTASPRRGRKSRWGPAAALEARAALEAQGRLEAALEARGCGSQLRAALEEAELGRLLEHRLRRSAARRAQRARGGRQRGRAAPGCARNPPRAPAASAGCRAPRRDGRSDRGCTGSSAEHDLLFAPVHLGDAVGLPESSFVAKLPSVATSRGWMISICLKRCGSQASISSGCGSRLPGGRHLRRSRRRRPRA